MTLVGAQNIVENELNRIANSEWHIYSRHSASTNSQYYKLVNGRTSLLFRISDHDTKADVSTLLISKKISEQTIRQYVRNRIKDFRKRSLKALLNI